MSDTRTMDSTPTSPRFPAPGAPASDDLTGQIGQDLAASPSVLAMLQAYVAQLAGQPANDALPFRKLRRLFELGSVPDRLEGHHYGVTLGLRTGDLHGVAAEHGNVLGLLWGGVVGGVCPWVGKSFAPMADAEVARVTGGAVPPGSPVSSGINHFHLIEHAPANLAATGLLALLWRLEEPPAEERGHYGHQRNGGHFAAYRARSVHPDSPREVLRLNYRFPALGNSPPLPWLIDEVVEIAAGLYLGQLLFATARLLERYEPSLADEASHYQHFGYFAIFDERWNSEARRLFPHLGMPDAALPAAPPVHPGPVAGLPARLSTPTLADQPTGDVDPEALASLRAELARSESILHLLQTWSAGLALNPSTQAPEFARLQALFALGIAPDRMEGFFHGANVTFQSQGLLALFDVNKLNLVWRLARHFSPWTGKRFDTLDPARLAELTGGGEPPGAPTALGSNTVVFRSAPERLVRTIMDLAGMWVEEATAEERRADGYDARAFFFVGKQAGSVLPGSGGKRVYQFNYRWKALRTPPPDNLCVDELVRIADGLYLGKLIYATELLRAWDPAAPPAAYAYRLFGYFLLMDDEWHALRLRLGFDLDNT